MTSGASSEQSTSNEVVAEVQHTSFESIMPKQQLEGTVKRVELQGAIIDVGAERDGLLHISQLSSEPVKNVTDVVNEGDRVTVYVLAIDKKSGRLDLTLVKPPDVTWNEVQTGRVYIGTVERIEKYGVFVNIGAERPGLVHVSELSTEYVTDPAQLVKVGEELEVKVIGINKRKRQIDLSVRALEATPEPEIEEDAEVITAMELALRRAMDGEGGGKGGRDKKRRREKGRRNEDEIFERTLRLHQGG